MDAQICLEVVLLVFFFVFIFYILLVLALFTICSWLAPWEYYNISSSQSIIRINKMAKNWICPSSLLKKNIGYKEYKGHNKGLLTLLGRRYRYSRQQKGFQMYSRKPGCSRPRNTPVSTCVCEFQSNWHGSIF